MNKDNMINIAKTGTTEDLINLLKSYGERKWDYYNIDSAHGSYGHCLDTICGAVTCDADAARKAAKTARIAAYTAHGKRALKQKISERPELETLRQIAFNGASRDVTALLKAQMGNEEAVSAIIEGAQKDRKRFYTLREKKADKERRANKKAVLTDYFTKTNDFAPDAISDQLQIEELKGKLAAMQGNQAKAIAPGA